MTPNDTVTLYFKNGALVGKTRVMTAEEAVGAVAVLQQTFPCSAGCQYDPALHVSSVTCRTCAGNGKKRFTIAGRKPKSCKTCGGKGYVLCPVCNGERFHVPNTPEQEFSAVVINFTRPPDTETVPEP